MFKLFIVVWYACAVSGSGTIGTVDMGRRSEFLVRVSENQLALNKSTVHVDERMSAFGTKDEAIDFAEHTKYNTDCSTTPARVYELVEIKEVK